MRYLFSAFCHHDASSLSLSLSLSRGSSLRRGGYLTLILCYAAARKEEDYYETLGVSRNASADEIKRQYYKLAMQYHPDRNKGDKAAEEKLQKINAAYSVYCCRSSPPAL